MWAGEAPGVGRQKKQRLRKAGRDSAENGCDVDHQLWKGERGEAVAATEGEDLAIALGRGIALDLYGGPRETAQPGLGDAVAGVQVHLDPPVVVDRRVGDLHHE